MPGRTYKSALCVIAALLIPSSVASRQSEASIPGVEPIAARALESVSRLGPVRGQREGRIPRHPALDANGQRDAKLWPYPSTSIWNMPLGDRAELVPTQLRLPSGPTLAVEEDIIVATPHAKPRPIYFSPAGWQRSYNRCAERTTRVLVRNARVAPDFVTDPSYTGLTPNHAAAILRPDGSLIETQPFHACPDGSLVALAAPPGWMGGSILTGDTAAKIDRGAHGASGLTAYGGTIRLGEWVPGGVIPHAIKIELWAARYLSKARSGYRWPASNADAYHQSVYGGANKALRMGALLALPRNFGVERKLRSPAARILAHALQKHGAYVVGDTFRDTIAVATEWGPRGRVLSEFQQVWGFPMSGTLDAAEGEQRTFLMDLRRIYRRLGVVDDNSPRHIGGKGQRLARMAPRLAPWSS